ncbi:ROK family transcriptional regulator [Microbacterium sp. H1-D42]|uniref:ROK family transcriptional regulator n=1 Tax=Microbacterium sp. H1-D42 TaxID=2925844 RepID=UPI001F53AB11|nr:ROK family transcriptional regulator [Microbacterium sp. H1-D42]UNK70475.1 ROK family transcriptional regulator [Microbacterium sp. H1-D42]
MSIKDDGWGATYAGDPSALRKMNITAVLRFLHSAPTDTDDGDGRYTVTEIAQSTGISRPTAEDAVDALIEQGWLVEAGPNSRAGRRSAGRPARTIRFDPQSGCVLGLDLAPHWVRVLVSDLAGRIIGRAEYPVAHGASVGERIAGARTATAEALRLADRDVTDILAATAATVGIAHADGTVVRSTLPELVGHNLSEMLGGFVPVPVRLVNDMRAAVLAEHWVGAAADCGSAVYLHAGRRLGTAYLIGGVSPLGHHGAAGEIPPESGRRLIDAYRKLASFTGVDVDALSREEMLGIDPRTVFEAAQRGETGARQAVIDFAEEFATGIEGLVITVDPEVVVVGGGVILAGDIAAEAIRSTLSDVCVFEPTVAVSPLGESAVALGAVRLALNEFEESLFANPLAPVQKVQRLE